MKNEELIRTIKFTLFSVSAGVIELGLYELLTRITPWSYWPRYLIALIASVVWNFTFNKNFTFRSATNVPIAMAKVFGYYLVFTPITTIGGNYLVETLHWNGTLVTIMNMVLNLITEYLFDRFVVFGKTIDTKKRVK